MAYDLKNKLVIGVSSCTLFDLRMENQIFEEQGKEAYYLYQTEHEKDICEPGPAFSFVKSLLELNKSREANTVEVILMSRNRAEAALRLFHSIAYYGLNITRSVFSSGAPLSPYFQAFGVDLFLSENELDVRNAMLEGIAAGFVSKSRIYHLQNEKENQVRFAFDGDAVLFSDDSERVYQKRGLETFERYETYYANIPMKEGPFLTLLRKLIKIKRLSIYNDSMIRTALVTARSAPAHERVIRTMRAWDVETDETFFLGGVQKK